MTDHSKHNSPERAATTVSFLWFAGLAVLLVFTVVVLTELQQKRFPVENFSDQKVAHEISTSNWPTYEDEGSGLSFKYPQNWKVTKVPLSEKEYMLRLSPTSATNESGAPKIFVSNTDYFGLAGLQAREVTIAGKAGVEAGTNLFGVQNGKYFFTFDGGYQQDLLPYFQAIRSTISL